MGTVSAWVLSVPTLVLVLFCIQDSNTIIDASYSNNWAEYLVQTIGPAGATVILSMLWVDSTCATASCFMSAQRVTYAISRDGVLPGSRFFRKLTARGKMPVNAAWLVYGISVAVTLIVIGSEVAFTAITATATIATNFSYLIPIGPAYRWSQEVRAFYLESRSRKLTNRHCIVWLDLVRCHCIAASSVVPCERSRYVPSHMYCDCQDDCL